MTAISTLPDFLDNLSAQLRLRTALLAVPVYTGEVDHLIVGQEAIVFAVEPTTVAFGYRTLPHKQVTETYPVEGRIWVVKAGAGEAVIAAARDRALTLFSEVVSEVVKHATDTSGSGATANCQTTFGVDDAKVSGYRLEQYVADGGRDCRIVFTIDVSARFDPSTA